MNKITRDDIVVIDTNIVRILTDPKRAIYRAYYMEHIRGRDMLLSFMTVHEAYWGIEKRGYDERRASAVLAGVRHYEVIGATDDVLKTSAKLRKLCIQEPLSMQDLFIASTAAALECQFVTDDGRLARALEKVGIRGVICRHLEPDTTRQD